MEKIPACKDLFDYISEKKQLSEDEARRFFLQLLHTIQECHYAGVLHRDLKDENILVNQLTGDIKVIDFGSGAFLQEEEYTDFDGEC